jgi:DNA polymerase III sliding clamp (beta) subunit (PCNA family)
MQLTTLKKLLKPLLAVPCDKKENLYLLVQEQTCELILLKDSNHRYDISITICNVSIPTTEDFAACINFKKLKAILTKLKSPAVDLAIAPTLFTINGLGIALEPLPAAVTLQDLKAVFVPTNDKFQLVFESKKFKKYLIDTSYCTSLDTTRNSLQCVWFMLNEHYNNIGAVATDGHKFSYASKYSISDLNLLAPTAIKKGIGIPFNICGLITKCATTAEDILLINLSRDSFKSTEGTIILALGSTLIKFEAVFNYPNWIACIPNLQQENTASVTVILAELIAKLESYKPFVHLKTKFILCELDKLNSQISFKLTNTSEIVGNLSAKFTNPNNTVSRLGLNLDYLLAHLYKMQAATGNKHNVEVTFYYNTEISAVTFYYEEANLDNSLIQHYNLQMPLRILEDKTEGDN